ncbi:MAG: caspase family protein [Chitinophagaceae bacterium]|nr:caspase family protein [Chitinophagaceae bacterium]
MTKNIFTLAFASLLTFSGFSQEKRALIIAIDKYEPPPNTRIAGTARSLFKNLDGCVNDGRAIQSIVVSKFQFPANKVDTLFNEAANRNGIIQSMNDLLEKSNANDFAFIYYAGHGSQVPNSLAREEDKKDESMVPSDTWKPGVQDIRDKELAKVYNAFLDKGVKLTVIMDCCHSGSLSRGPNTPGQFRFIADANYDAKDASQPTPPETRPEGNFLIISAAQDNEFAQEQRDENNIPHGAFTIALRQALEQQSVNASVINLFTSIRAILKSNGKKQEPVLGGKPERQQQTLFGITKGTLPDKSLIAVSGFEFERVFLQGGFALGLNKENELVKFKGTDTLVKLEIDSVYGVNKSRARIVKGNIKDLKAGELLEVTNWVSSSAPLLKVYIPAGKMNYSAITRLAGINSELRQSKKIKWVNELEKNDPYTTLYFDGEKYRVNIDGKEVAAPGSLNTAAILQLCKQDSSFYFELPVPGELTEAIKMRLQSSKNKSIVVVNNIADAQYVLYGTIDENGKPAYGLRRTQTSARDSLESMPVQTKGFVLEDGSNQAAMSVSDNLYEYAMRLSKIRGWIQLIGPKEGESNFPFHLEMKNKTTGSTITNNEYRVGEQVAFHLVANDGFTGANKVKRFVYVFIIDKDGNMTLAYPDADAGNVGNQFPKFENFNLVKDVFLFEGTVSEPVGTDNYFLLASDEPITNYAMVFNQEGVRSAARGDGSPLGDLLNIGNEGGTRGFNKSVSNWNLIKLSVKSRY